MKGTLAPALQALIHPHTGDIKDIRPAPRGYSSDFVAVVECANGPFFTKAVENEPGWRRNAIICERTINPFVHLVSPSLRWQAENEDWIALGFEVVDGRQAVFDVGSDDLPAVVDLINRIGALDLPEAARRWQETRWDRYATHETEAELFRGDALLYVDINPANFIIGQQGAWVVDWADCSRGAAFIDPAILVLQLVSSGHSPESAESWAARCLAWADASTNAIDAFVAATTRMYQERARREADEPWFEAMAQAVESWASHRGIVVS